MYEYTYIWLICMVNVGKYASPMDDMGRFHSVILKSDPMI